jgi:hypothetical protein
MKTQIHNKILAITAAVIAALPSRGPDTMALGTMAAGLGCR